MSRFQVYQKVTVENTEIEVYVSSMSEAERQAMGGMGDDSLAPIASLVAAHVHDTDDLKGKMFTNADAVQADLTTGQLQQLMRAILKASGMIRDDEEIARFPDSGVEGSGAESPPAE